MKVRLVVLLISSVIAFASNSLAVEIINSDEAEDFYKSSTIVNFDSKAGPRDLIGTLVFYKDGEEAKWEYVSILPEDTIKDMKPIDNSKLIYQSMATSEFVVKAKYLSFFSAEVTKKHLLEIVMEDKYDLTIPSFLNDANIKDNVFLYGKILRSKGYTVEFIDKVNLTTITTRLFEEGKQEGGFNYFVSADAKNYNSTTNFRQKDLISAHSVNMNAFLDEQKGLLTAKANEVPGRSFIPTLSKTTLTEILK